MQRLVCDMVKANAPELSLIDRDIFRSAKLYTPEVEDVLKKYNSSTKAIFEFYAGSEDESGARANMSLEEFQRVLGDAEALDSVFTRREAAFCFIYSQAAHGDRSSRGW